MRYETRLAPLRLLILLCMALVLPACAGASPIVSTPVACSSLLPDDWRKAVPGADLPQGNTVGDWMLFAEAQTAQLDKANDRGLAAIGIVERCEERHREAVDRARKKWWQIFR